MENTKMIMHIIENIFFSIIIIIIPAYVIIRYKDIIRSLLVGILICWAGMVLASQYNLYTDPTYDSFAPGLSIWFGWLYGMIYCGPIALIKFIIVLIWKKREKAEPGKK